jgi:nitroreductase
MSTILEAIKNRSTVRSYRKRRIARNILKRIVEAGLWSSSLHNFQPWRFIVIENRNLISRIAKTIVTTRMSGGIDSILKLTAQTIKNAPLIIIVYNDKTFSSVSEKLFRIPHHFLTIAEKSEVETVSAAIQNMILVAHENSIESCWNTMPLFAERRLNKLLKVNAEMVALITMGYSAAIGRRCRRKQIEDKVLFLK